MDKRKILSYGFQIIDARAVAAGLANHYKAELYRLKPDADDTKDFGGKAADYSLGNTQGWTMPSSTPEASPLASLAENKWAGNSDYWLGRTVLTDLLIEVPDEEIGTILLNNAVISVSKQKEVVKTVLVGRKGGTVKEYITDGDYQVNISLGLVAVDENGKQIDQYPEQAVALLRRALEVDAALTVSSLFLDLFEINKIVVTGFSAKQMTHSNQQTIEVTAISDTDYVIQSTDY